MSKVSAMQAMREARYAASRTARPAVPAAASTPPARRETPARPGDGSIGEPSDALVFDVGPAATDSPADTDGRPPAAGHSLAMQARRADDAQPADDVQPPADAAAEALCGHRSMNNRTCRRPAGHPEKNHRYN